MESLAEYVTGESTACFAPESCKVSGVSEGCPGIESVVKFTALMRLRMKMSGFRAYHVCLSIVLIILAFDIVAISQIQGFQDRAMETQARVWSFRHGQTIQFVDPRTGNVYAKPLWGSSKVMVNGRSLRVNEVVDILFARAREKYRIEFPVISLKS